MSSPSLAELTDRLLAFRDARDWAQFHGLKDLMLSLQIEAAELLELAQWKSDAQLEGLLDDPDFRARLADETADVLSYLLLLCDRAGIDPARAVADKVDRNEQRYPAHLSQGNARKYTEL